MDPETTNKLRRSAGIIRGWLDDCTADHQGSGCNASSSSTTPKRLIWLDPASNIARLVDTPIPVPEYVALSYVWGPTESNIRTLKSNVEQMYQDIPFSEMPLTLQHVFQIARYLDIHFLWIDTLCIVQDDQDEKAVEIGRMEYVYLNSALQISAMASPGAQHGLLQTRQYLPAQRDQHHLIMKACRSLKQKFWDEQLQRDYCLLTRGWAYQERMLSRRIVHFTVFELLWECKQTRWCECGMIEHPSGSMTNMINNMSAAFEACVRADSPPPNQIIPLWRECVMGYSRGRLTVKNDRLPAISGIGRMLGGRSGEEAYVAGMRRDALPFDLLWRSDQSSKLPLEKTRKPSWSWGSVDCGVDWPTNEQKGTVEAVTESEKSLAHIISGTFFEQDVTGVEVVGIEAKPAGVVTTATLQSVAFGSVEYAKLVLAAKVIPVSIRSHPDSAQWHASHGTQWSIAGGQERPVLPFYPDVAFVEDQNGGGAIEKLMKSGVGLEGYSLMEIATVRSGGTRWEAGLVVRRSLDGKMAGSVERVGMAGFPKCRPQGALESWFDGASMGIMSLV